ncbi:putative hydrolase [Gordonia effusa NBRC 100432]|uniref:Putative hydrolase n=1 Tax=Gordonia effusa NBRC 100432 TaxID=1077974 RepID=H0QUH1_9ACTN|nr:alpha/beta fold hydrolase [Gordonia effusa]GAB16472.1 putative hydrolase [Gordonia effusa NBRC 100432]
MAPPSLNTTVFPGIPGAPTVLALHGLTGHGLRWAQLATEYLSDVRVVAPDLLGHGHSSWTAPWSYDAHLDALEAVFDDHIDPAELPIVIVAHSFGAGLAIRLSQRRPDAVRGLVLLDPAQGLPPDWAAQIAAESMAHWTYADADAARAAKRAEGWAMVPDDILDAEIAAHLMDVAGGVGWRVSQPAAATAWSEMARPAVFPLAHIPTTIVVADRVRPPFVSAEFLDTASKSLDAVDIRHVDCEHMVPLIEPELVAALIRERL